MIMYSLCIVSLLIHQALAACPNFCSGHGNCGANNVCSCFSGWDGGAADCSLKSCPYGVAWADKAYALDSAHQQAECSNAGICDRTSGLCQCFQGFTGIACQRSTCPNNCNGRGLCTTIRDISVFEGVDYDSSVDSAGDGLGVEYTNWDKLSLTVCNCDYGYFGPDCSQVMCPKGDDPVTDNQDFRVILLTVDGPANFGGDLGFTFQGERTLLPIATMSDAACESLLEASDKFADVTCDYTAVSTSQHTFRITFNSWPLTPKENNLYTHNGNPAISEFTCDMTRIDVSGVTCTFTDVTTTNLVEYEYCSNRGICDFNTGECLCMDGFGGPGCEVNTFSYTAATNSLVGYQVNVNGESYTSSAFQINVAKSAAPDFNIIEGLSKGKQVFYARGDGELSALRLRITQTGATIVDGGLVVDDGGVTISNDGAYIYNEEVAGPVIKVVPTSTVYADNAVEISGSAVNPSNYYSIRSENSNVAKFTVRGDGYTQVHDKGLGVTGGATIDTGGMKVSGGVTIKTAGLYVTGGTTVADRGLTVSQGLSIYSDGLHVTGGATIKSGGLTVDVDGFLVSAGGGTIATGGFKVNNGGGTIESGGLKVTTGVSVQSGGLRVTGGATIHETGFVV
eukprot:CAMPEP_0185021030 /NCGR_PEP_ID=MMETSP1103-20130426/3691_1 /TAXON_ID=36769 /ORGANISM="Paraphysomonas bandaiensis, Strain Caron Lab Isolate" /LENGTH=622 /DNA_ID=CAMNT_0027552303 /DNA_START=60 /DNA_END=1924 /DNA_ORIENTATION=+